MATKDDNPARAAGKGPKSLKEHPSQQRIEAHKEAAQLSAHDPADDETIVPAVTADVDETPKFIKYGAAVLLGLAFGVGCYVWVDGGVPSAPQNPGRQLKIAPTAEYFANAGTYHAPSAQGVLPDPFISPYEPSLSPDYDATDATLSEFGTAESVEPLAPADITDAETTAQTTQAVSVPTVVYLFAYDSSTVPENTELTAIANKAKQNGLSLDVKAYTDEHGRAAYNKRLSEKRAKAIGDYLIAHGVPASKVSVHGMGSTHAYPSDAQDRRAEITPVQK